MTSGASPAIFGSFGRRRQTNDLQSSSTLIVERLRDGPVPELLNPMNGSEQTWSLGARMKAARSTLLNLPHTMRGGAVWSAPGERPRAGTPATSSPMRPLNVDRAVTSPADHTAPPRMV